MITTSNNTANNAQVRSIDLTRPIEPCSPLVADILNVIFSQSDIKSLGNISSVSREWHVASEKDINWQSHKNKFKVEEPNLKAKIKESAIPLDEVFSEIDAKVLEPKNKTFSYELVKVLFEGNVRSIKVTDGFSWYGKSKWFTLEMKEEKLINFNNTSIFNIFIPKKVLFTAARNGLEFTLVDNNRRQIKEHYPIEINNTAMSFGINKCTSISLDFFLGLQVNCLYESNILAHCPVSFRTNNKLLDTIKKT